MTLTRGRHIPANKRALTPQTTVMVVMLLVLYALHWTDCGKMNMPTLCV